MSVFKMNHSMIVAGPSNTGKTTFIQNLLKNKSKYFNQPIKRVLWCFSEFKPSIKGVVFIKGLPDTNQLSQGDLLILDDLAFDANKDVTNIFTRLSHHRKIFTIFVTQNMFEKGNRTRSLNTHYFILFRNPRDKMQITVLARQMGLSFLTNVFDDVTRNKPYSYIMVDLTATTPDHLRIQSDVLTNRRYYISKGNFNLKEIYQSIMSEDYKLSSIQLKKLENNKQNVENILKSKPFNEKALTDIVVHKECDNYYII